MLLHGWSVLQEGDNGLVLLLVQVPSELVMNNPVYPRLLVVLKKKITNGKMRSRQLANILWALAKMGHDVEDVIDLLLDEIERVGNLALHVPKTHFSLSRHSPSWGEHAGAPNSRPCPAMTFTDATATCWHIATSKRETGRQGQDSPSIKPPCVCACEQTQMATWQDQEISNVVWSLATLGRPHTRLLDAFSREVLRRGMDKLVPQAVSNMVWGFATLDYSNTAFMIVSPSPSPPAVLMSLSRCHFHDSLHMMRHT